MNAADAAPAAYFQDLDALLSSAPDAMLLVDQDGCIGLLNRHCEKMLGYRREELIGKPVEVLVPAALHELHRRQRSAYQREPTVREMASGIELVAVRKDGVELPVEISLAPFTTQRGPLVLAALRDVSRSRRDVRMFRAFVDAAPDAVIVADREGVITLVNSRAEDMFGYSRTELLGHSVQILIPDRFTDVLDSRREYVDDPESRPVVGMSGDLYGRRKDGTEVPIEISLAKLETEEGTLVLADVRDISERIEIMAAVRDVEERQRIQEETNRAKDDFLATVSHELRTPLTSMLGFAELMADSGQLTPECEHHLAVITRNGQRELRLVEDLLTLGTISDGRLTIHPVHTDLVVMIENSLEAAAVKADDAGVFLHSDLPDSPVQVHCDPERIGQVLDILLSNALKFTPRGGDIAVRMYVEDRTVRIEVADSGIGIVDAEPHRVFERLYRSTTAIANEVPGVGIGLAIASAIVESHRGSLRLLHSDESGTTFGLDLPLSVRLPRQRNRSEALERH